jgi:hypothetical protein
MATPISPLPSAPPSYEPRLSVRPGDVLGGRFEIRGELGRGGMATVYLALDRTRGERVALKVLHEHLAADAGGRARLGREIRAASRLRHPRVLVAHEIHEIDGRLMLTMPVNTGGSLAERLEQGPLGAEALRRLALDLAGALAEAHRCGVIHRDITPNNVLLDDERRPLLADFGLARLDGSATATATALGTWGFTAPEVYDGQGADPRSDLYSLGAVLYAAAAGRPPFEAPAAAAVLRRQLAGDLAPLAALRPDLPAPLVAVIEAMLEVSPERRPQGAREVEEALAEGVALAAPALPVPVGAEGPGYTVEVSELKPDRRRRRRLRRLRGGVTLEEPAAPERALARDAERLLGAGLNPGELPAAMRRRRFQLVEGADYETARLLAERAIVAGFSARVLADPHANRARHRGALKVAAGSLTALATLVLLIVSLEEGAPPLFLLSGLLTAWLLRTGIGATARPVLSVDRKPAALAAPADPLEGAWRRVDGQLEALERAVDGAVELLPGAVLHDLRRTARALRVRADDLRLEGARLGEGAARTRLLARMLELGAAASGATRQLGAAADGGSAPELLERLALESRAAARALREVEAPEAPAQLMRLSPTP